MHLSFSQFQVRIQLQSKFWFWTIPKRGLVGLKALKLPTQFFNNVLRSWNILNEEFCTFLEEQGLNYAATRQTECGTKTMNPTLLQSDVANRDSIIVNDFMKIESLGKETLGKTNVKDISLDDGRKLLFKSFENNVYNFD